jgi:hypothetical protein
MLKSESCTKTFGDNLVDRLRYAQAPWPLGVTAWWYDAQVFNNCDYYVSTEHMDLADHASFMWTA